MVSKNRIVNDCLHQTCGHCGAVLVVILLCKSRIRLNLVEDADVISALKTNLIL